MTCGLDNNQHCHAVTQTAYACVGLPPICAIVFLVEEGLCGVQGAGQPLSYMLARHLACLFWYGNLYCPASSATMYLCAASMQACRMLPHAHLKSLVMARMMLQGRARMMPQGKGRKMLPAKGKGSYLHTHDELVSGKREAADFPRIMCAGGQPSPL